jgi:hypothetical protein
MIVAMHTPERNVRRVERESVKPKNLRRPAYFHHPTTVMNPNMPTTVAIAEIGNSTVPLTGPCVLVKSPFESAFVRAAVRCVEKIEAESECPDFKVVPAFFREHIAPTVYRKTDRE